MSSVQSTSSAQSSPKALVLGRADGIVRDLRSEGFDVLTESGLSGPLPRLSDPHALSTLKALLSGFVEIAGRSRSPYAPCLHPGVSPWAERPELVLVGQELGLNVLSPPAKVVSLFANKLNLLGDAERAGVPTLLIAGDPITGVRQAEAMLTNAKPGFPMILKSVRGGEGSGVLVVHAASDLHKRLPLWIEQLRNRTGDPILFAERYLEGARRVTVPFARFKGGRCELFPLTDSSLQSRNRKIVEFCPAERIEPEVETQLLETTERLASHWGYVGVGALEFLVDGTRIFLINGMTRLNTGFPLWERVAGTSAVSWQLAAAESRLIRDVPTRRPQKKWACGIALRILAEDPLLQLPQPGYVREVPERTSWSLPGAEATLDLHVEAGQEIAACSDGLVAQLWVGGRDRRQALNVARGILDETWFTGSLQTNERFLSELLLHPWVKEGIFHAGFVDEEFIPEVRPGPELMRIFGSICMPLGSSAHKWAVGDQWVKPDPGLVDWLEGPVTWEFRGRPGLSGVLLAPDERRLRISAFPTAEGRWQVRVGSWMLAVRSVDPNSASARARKAGQHRLVSLVSGRIHSVLYREQATVPAHEPLAIIESLQTLVPHALPVDVRITRWSIRAEEEVKAGQELAWFETAARPSV